MPLHYLTKTKVTMSDRYNNGCIPRLPQTEQPQDRNTLEAINVILARAYNTRGGHLTDICMLFNTLKGMYLLTKHTAFDHDALDSIKTLFTPRHLCGTCWNCFVLCLIWLVELAQLPEEKKATASLIQALHSACYSETKKNPTSACCVSWLLKTSPNFECVFSPPGLRPHLPPPLPHERRGLEPEGYYALCNCKCCVQSRRSCEH